MRLIRLNGYMVG